MAKKEEDANTLELRLKEIKEKLQVFSGQYLNAEYETYLINLVNLIKDTDVMYLERGRIELWAAAIIHVIARLNFLFDKNHENHIAPDTISSFFKTNKRSVGNKASEIMYMHDLTHGIQGISGQEINDLLTFYRTPEGFLIPKNTLDRKNITIELLSEEETAELEKQRAEQERKLQAQRQKKRELQAERQRERMRERREARRDKNQLGLFGDS